MRDPSLTFNGLTLGYNSHPAVHHLMGVLPRGSLTAIVGPNGSGKSTLMKGIVGILPPISGAFSVGNGQRIAYLPQQSELDKMFPARVIDLVSLGLWSTRGLLGRITGADKMAMAAALEAVGLSGFETRALDTLSGGQMQRALFARVLAQDANLILLDEPFNAVDTKTVGDLVALIHHWHSERRTVVVVAHDVALVKQHFPETLLLARQKIAWGATKDVLNDENLARARRFTEAWNENAAWCDEPGDMAHSHDHGHQGHVHHGHHHHHDDKTGA
jgi:zinc/manganese transport system ATP-binding protein